MTIKRSIGEIRALPDNVEETRTIEFVLSTESKDRHGTVLNIDGWDLKKYNSNPIVGYQHDVYGDNWFTKPDPDSVIGIGKVWKEDKKLIGSVKFEPAEINPIAEKVFRKVLFGSLRAVSVGFLPTGKGKMETVGNETIYYYGTRELLEFSIVNIPSNADALKRKFEDELTEEEKEEIKETPNPTDVPDYERVDKLIRLTKIQ